MNEFDRDMLRVARAAAVAHHPKLASLLKSPRHLCAEFGDLLGIQSEKFLLHVDGLAAFAQNFFAERATDRLRAIAFRQHGGSLPFPDAAHRRNTPRTRLRPRPWWPRGEFAACKSCRMQGSRAVS